jgi:hypothetical protein
MPDQIAPADRRLLVAAAAVAVVLMAATVVFAPGNSQGESGVPSSYSADSGGALAAYLLLRDLHYNVHRWEESPTSLDRLGQGAVLIVAGPTETPTNREREALRAFVRRGGRLLFCGGSVAEFFPEALVSPRKEDGSWKEYDATFPSYFSRGARTIVIRPEASLVKAGAPGIDLYGDSAGSVVAAWPIGTGEVLWWAGATPLTNAGIGRGSNLQLFLNAVDTRPLNAMQTPAAIYWDEYFHGQRTSLWSYVAQTPVAWALAQAALLMLAALFTFSRRWGPIVRPAAVSRLSPLEFVDTLGGLYQRAGATAVAVAVTYRHLRMRLTQQLGIPASAPDEELARAAGVRLGWKPEPLREALAQASAAAGPQPRQALALIRTMESYAAQLGMRRVKPAEKK